MRLEQPFDIEAGSQAVEIGLADRVVLVVVTRRAAHLQAEEHRADRPGHVVEERVPPLLLQVDVRHVRSAKEEAGRDQRGLVAGPQFVAGKLQADELVERHVAVVSVDHPIAKPPSVRPHMIVLEPIGLGEARDIQPMLSPPFPVTRRRQQPIHQPLVPIW